MEIPASSARRVEKKKLERRVEGAVQLRMMLEENEAALAEKGERLIDAEQELRRLKQQLARTKEQITSELQQELLGTMREEKAQAMRDFMSSRGDELSDLRTQLREETKKEVEREMRDEITKARQQMQQTLAEEREKMKTGIYAEMFDKLKRHQPHENATHEGYLTERIDRTARATIPKPDWLNRSQPPLRLHKSLQDMWEASGSFAPPAGEKPPAADPRSIAKYNAPHKALKDLGWETL